MTAMTSTCGGRLKHLGVWILLCLLAACSDHAFPTQPSAAAPTPISLEGEAGSGDGQIIQRSRASRGQTVHLGPGQRRLWTFALSTMPAEYALAITYANGEEGDNEIISVTVNGAPVHSFQNRDSGDSIEGWNLFVTDPAGVLTLGAGSHTLVLEVSGGDGCVEIDTLTLTPTAAGA
jgi:hypothetical protein